MQPEGSDTMLPEAPKHAPSEVRGRGFLIFLIGLVFFGFAVHLTVYYSYRAIRAGLGEWGLIPGSMGTGSYVVKGLGNEASYWSASHGAGRRMSRSKAKRTFTVEDLVAQTAGVECRKDAGVVDEIPGAYKDLGAVIEAQVDLVEVVARLTTLMCVKG